MNLDRTLLAVESRNRLDFRSSEVFLNPPDRDDSLKDINECLRKSIEGKLELVEYGDGSKGDAWV